MTMFRRIGIEIGLSAAALLVLWVGWHAIVSIQLADLRQEIRRDVEESLEGNRRWNRANSLDWCDTEVTDGLWPAADDRNPDVE